jgi:hypothetical protein
MERLDGGIPRMSELKFKYREEIDIERWNSLMDTAVNSMIYGYSWYLDAITDGRWGAVIDSEYRAVFPLPWRRKFGVSYIYQPYFCQQLGLFAHKEYNKDQSEFVAAIPKKFKRIHLQINSDFNFTGDNKPRPNYLLDLTGSYTDLQSAYKEDAVKNLKKTSKLNVEYSEIRDPELVLELHKNIWGDKNPEIRESDYLRFTKACMEAHHRDMLWSITASSDGVVLGSAIFLKSPKYLHYLISGPTLEGRKLSIMHGIIDYAIKAHAGSGLILDFEGSKIPDVAAFYAKWGSTVKNYKEILINRWKWL